MVVGVLQNEEGRTRGEGGEGQNSGILSERTFLNAPFPSRRLATDFTDMYRPMLLFGKKKNIKTRTLIGLTEIIYSER